MENIYKTDNYEEVKKRLEQDTNLQNQKETYLYDVPDNFKIDKKIKKSKKIKLKIESKIDKKEQLLNNRITDYIDFLKKINFSNNLMVNS
jgi:hypothetical protein